MGQTSSTLFGSVKDYTVADTDHGADAIAAWAKSARIATTSDGDWSSRLSHDVWFSFPINKKSRTHSRPFAYCNIKDWGGLCVKVF